MKCTNIIFSFIEIISVKTKSCIVQMFNTSLPGTHCNERITFVRNMTDNVYGGINNFFQIQHELFPVKFAELKTNKAMSYSPYFKWCQFFEIANKDRAII